MSPAPIGHVEPAFINRLTHDLRVPFAAVRSALYLLERHGENVSGTREKKWLEAVGNSLATFESLLKAVDAHAQALSYLPPASPTCNLHEIIQGALAIASEAHPNRAPTSWLDDDVECTQGLDGTMLGVAVRQLLDNAIRHAPPDRPATLRLESRPGGWQLTVSNEGPAIPAEEYPRLFTPFFHSRSSLAAQGPGLGLATAAIAATKAGCRLFHERRDDRTHFCLSHAAVPSHEG